VRGPFSEIEVVNYNIRKVLNGLLKGPIIPKSSTWLRLQLLHTPPATTHCSIILILVALKHLKVLRRGTRISPAIELIEEIPDPRSNIIHTLQPLFVGCFGPVDCRPGFASCWVLTQVVCVNSETQSVSRRLLEKWPVICCTCNI
jgi:hypothetical protein